MEDAAEDVGEDAAKGDNPNHSLVKALSDRIDSRRTFPDAGVRFEIEL